MNMAADMKYPEVRQAILRLFVLIDQKFGRKLEDGEIADLLKIPRPVFSYYKNGNRKVTHRVAQQMADILQDDSVLDLFGFTRIGQNLFLKNVPTELADILLEIQKRIIAMNVDPNSDTGKQMVDKLLGEYFDNEKRSK